MTAALDEKLNAWKELKYAKKLNEAREEIIKEFDRRFQVDKEIKQEGDKEAVKKLKDAADEAMQTIDGELRTYIDEFEAYEKGLPL